MSRQYRAGEELDTRGPLDRSRDEALMELVARQEQQQTPEKIPEHDKAALFVANYGETSMFSDLTKKSRQTSPEYNTDASRLEAYQQRLADFEAGALPEESVMMLEGIKRELEEAIAYAHENHRDE